MKHLMKLTLALGMLGTGVAFAQQKPVEVTFWSWYISPKFDDYMKSTIAAFEKQNPNITVRWFDKQDSMAQDFIAAVNLGNAPCVVNMNIDETSKAAQNGYLRPLDTVASKAVLDQYYPNTIKNFSVNGKPYGFPWYGWLNQGVLIVNPALTQKAGITRIPRDFNELISFSKTIKDKTGAYGYVPAYKDPNTASFLGTFYQEGLSVTGADGKANFNSAAHAKLLQQYVDYYKGGYSPQDAIRREAFQIATELFAQGKLAYIIGGPQALTRIKDNNPSLYNSLQVAAAPLGAARVETGGGMDLVLSNACKTPQEAAKFASFVTNNANQVAFAKVVPIVPTTRAAKTNALFRTTSKDPVAKATALTGANGDHINPGYSVPKNADDLYKNFNDNIEAAVLGQKTAQQALNDAVTFWNSNAK